ncbi:egg cell-secreted protein 1.1 [Phtheirospermum japonicum]|uniref:Egg cell-secreted protein 1.1 n=1 Tax=Phtheirospermum japonicum TaxID=374723 RepID=A0A830C6U7_9LAMI|nr:egg cell-secreted protein 1.1 [Phtheirospermum japonicum]
MNPTFKLLPIALLLCFSLSNLATTARILDSGSKPTLAARLKLEKSGDEGSSNCWESMFQLQSCTTEIVLFFLNGETFLGPGCCQAIRTIQKDCWPDLLGSLGYTTEEGDVLEGYCDASEDSSSAVPAPPQLAH